MKRDGYIIQDKYGCIRVPENIKLKDARGIAEEMFIQSGKDIDVKELDISFAEYDEQNGIKRKSSGERWTREHEEFFLLHADEDNDTLANRMNKEFNTTRSGMSIKMKYDAIVRPFDSWCDTNKDILKELSRKEKIDKYMDR